MQRVTTSWPAWITSNYMHSRRQTAIDGWQASNDPAICNETDERGCEPEYKDITASYGRSSSAGLLDTSNTASGYETDQSTGSNDRKSSCTSDRRLQGLTLRPASSHSPANKCESRQSIVELAEEDISAHHPPRSMASMSEYVEPTCSLEPNAPPLAGGFGMTLPKPAVEAFPQILHLTRERTSTLNPLVHWSRIQLPSPVAWGMRLPFSTVETLALHILTGELSRLLWLLAR